MLSTTACSAPGSGSSSHGGSAPDRVERKPRLLCEHGEDARPRLVGEVEGKDVDAAKGGGMVGVVGQVASEKELHDG